MRRCSVRQVSYYLLEVLKAESHIGGGKHFGPSSSESTPLARQLCRPSATFRRRSQLDLDSFSELGLPSHDSGDGILRARKKVKFLSTVPFMQQLITLIAVHPPHRNYYLQLACTDGPPRIDIVWNQ